MSQQHILNNVQDIKYIEGVDPALMIIDLNNKEWFFPAIGKLVISPENFPSCTVDRSRLVTSQVLEKFIPQSSLMITKGFINQDGICFVASSLVILLSAIPKYLLDEYDKNIFFTDPCKEAIKLMFVSIAKKVSEEIKVQNGTPKAICKSVIRSFSTSCSRSTNTLLNSCFSAYYPDPSQDNPYLTQGSYAFTFLYGLMLELNIQNHPARKTYAIQTNHL